MSNSRPSLRTASPSYATGGMPPPIVPRWSPSARSVRAACRRSGGGNGASGRSVAGSATGGARRPSGAQPSAPCLRRRRHGAHHPARGSCGSMRSATSLPAAAGSCTTTSARSPGASSNLRRRAAVAAERPPSLRSGVIGTPSGARRTVRALVALNNRRRASRRAPQRAADCAGR